MTVSERLTRLEHLFLTHMRDEPLNGEELQKLKVNFLRCQSKSKKRNRVKYVDLKNKILKALKYARTQQSKVLLLPQMRLKIDKSFINEVIIN